MEPGLCAACRHAHVVEGARSRFWLCGRSRLDPSSFPRYPALPVRRCSGYEPDAPPDRPPPAPGTLPGR